MEFCPRIVLLKLKKYQSTTDLKKRAKLVLKTVLTNYGFNFKNLKP